MLKSDESLGLVTTASMERLTRGAGPQGPRRPEDNRVPRDPIPAYSGFRGGQAYNEAAFQHFLNADRQRARRSMRSFLLVLVTVRESLGKSATLSDATAAALLGGLRASIREVDFVGWHREGRVAAAVLPQDGTAVDAQQRFVERLLPALKKRLSGDEAKNLRVRVVRLGARSVCSSP